ncbi:MAG: Hsp20/alpha crystallin family protein [Salinirussus sp.]
MRRDDRDDPFEDFFEQLERMMNDMMGGQGEFRISTGSHTPAASRGTGVHYDVHETDDEVRVVADLPGVTKEGIDLQCDGRTLSIEAGGAEREYREQIRLPRRVDEHSASANYNNGILEVTFDSETDSTNIEV